MICKHLYWDFEKAKHCWGNEEHKVYHYLDNDFFYRLIRLSYKSIRSLRTYWYIPMCFDDKYLEETIDFFSVVGVEAWRCYDGNLQEVPKYIESISIWKDCWDSSAELRSKDRQEAEYRREYCEHLVIRGVRSTRSQINVESIIGTERLKYSVLDELYH